MAMKWMVASDIHGSAHHAQALIEAFEREGAQRLLLLGDLLYHGARNDLPDEYDTRRVFAMLNGIKEKILAVRGNCDSEVDQMVLEFPMMADYALLQVGELTIFATHGHIASPDTPPPMAPGTLFVSGHTHVSGCEKRGDCWFANPGSVSIPKEGSVRGYMILEGRMLTAKTLPGEEVGRYVLAAE